MGILYDWFNIFGIYLTPLLINSTKPVFSLSFRLFLMKARLSGIISMANTFLLMFATASVKTPMLLPASDKRLVNSYDRLELVKHIPMKAASG